MSRRSKRWDTWANRQYRGHERRSKNYAGRHETWWELGQHALNWLEYKRANHITDDDEERMREKMPF